MAPHPAASLDADGLDGVLRPHRPMSGTGRPASAPLPVYVPGAQPAEFEPEILPDHVGAGVPLACNTSAAERIELPAATPPASSAPPPAPASVVVPHDPAPAPGPAPTLAAPALARPAPALAPPVAANPTREVSAAPAPTPRVAAAPPVARRSYAPLGAAVVLLVIGAGAFAAWMSIVERGVPAPPRDASAAVAPSVMPDPAPAPSPGVSAALPPALSPTVDLEVDPAVEPPAAPATKPTVNLTVNPTVNPKAHPPSTSVLAGSPAWEVHFGLNSPSPVDLGQPPDWVRRCPVLRVVGHGCGLGGEAVNLRLGEARAAAVRDGLQGQGITSQIHIESVGSADPALVESSAAARRRNRRAVVTCDDRE